MVNQNNKKGFTIIEVVLVLAIAGLIFLMVFIALPALQRGQRDTQRRDDMSKFLSQVNSYSTNNNGRVPAANDDTVKKTGTGFLDSYLKRNDGEFQDPQTGENYDVIYGVGNNKKGNTKTIVYATQAECNGEDIVTKSGATRSVAIQIELEGSGYFCQDNQ